jgi:FkbM family methyltransferase
MTNIPAPPSKVIYDFGANNGDDLPYYLQKGDRVVAVEANPLLASEIEQRFAREIAERRLLVENCVVTDEDAAENVPFYLHKYNFQLSQFPRPTKSNIANFQEVLLPSKSVSNLVATHGDPFYIKIDLEHYDEVILRRLFQQNIRPPFISVESHSIEVFCTLVSLGKYNSFNIVDGNSVAERYKCRTINSNVGQTAYSFPHRSSGPFGDDIDGPWWTASQFFYLLAFERLGWKDIHATSVISPDPKALPRFGTRAELQRAVKKRVTTLVNTITPKPELALTKKLRRVFSRSTNRLS